jgi:hypothetical protein
MQSHRSQSHRAETSRAGAPSSASPSSSSLAASPSALSSFIYPLLILHLPLRVVFDVARAPRPAEHTGAVAPTAEQATNALVSDGEEVLLWVRVRRNEVQSPYFGSVRAGGEVACKLWRRRGGTLLAQRRSQEGGQRVVALGNVLQRTRVTKVRERDQKVLTQELEQTRVGKDTTTLWRGTFVSVCASRARVSDNGVR